MWYWIFKFIFNGVLRTCYRLKVEGLDNLPKKTNYIVVSNHESWLDSLFFVAVIPIKIHGLSARHLYRSTILRWFLKRIEAISTGKSSIKALSVLENNKILALFPEGGCSRTGKLRKFRKGASFLALKTGRPVIPCAISGTFKAFPVWAKLPKIFLPIKIKIGKPLIFLKEFEGLIDDIKLEEVTARIKNAVEELKYAE